MCKFSNKSAMLLVLLAVAAVVALSTVPCAHAASVKIIYQSPPDGLKLSADKTSIDAATLAAGGYTSLRVVAHVRASSLGANKVEVRLDHDDPYLSPNSSSPKISFPLWSKTLANDAYTTTLIDKPGANVKLNVNVAAGSGEFYTVDVFVYGFK